MGPAQVRSLLLVKTAYVEAPQMSSFLPVLLGSAVASANPAMSVGDAKLGDIVDKTSLVGLECKRPGLDDPMDCILNRKKNGSVTVLVHVTLHPKDSDLVLSGRKLQAVFEGGTVSVEDILKTARQFRTSLMRNLRDEQGFTIDDVDGGNVIHLSGPRGEAKCWASGDRGKQATLTSRARNGRITGSCLLKSFYPGDVD